MLSVWQLTGTSVVNPAIRTRCRNQETRTFFGRKIFFAGKFSGRKLKNRKNFGAKVENPKNFPVEILKTQKSSGRKFVRPNFFGWKSKMPGNFGAIWFWLDGGPDSLHPAGFLGSCKPPLLRRQSPEGDGAHMRFPGYYLYREQPTNAGNTSSSQWGDAHAAGATAPRSVSLLKVTVGTSFI
jgi:hypothetical protein